jgi:hypothetical protein
MTNPTTKLIHFNRIYEQTFITAMLYVDAKYLKFRFRHISPEDYKYLNLCGVDVSMVMRDSSKNLILA